MVDYTFKSSKCTHDGLIHVCSIGKCRVISGSSAELADFVKRGYEPKAIVFLNGHIGFERMRTAIVETFYDGDGILSEISIPTDKTFPTVVVNWPDMAAPPLALKWFERLLKVISGIDGDVVFCCQAGHGRTGTTVAALAHMAGLTNGASDCISWLRPLYCEAAVESSSQYEWLRKNVDPRVPEPPPVVSYYSNKTYEFCADCKKPQTGNDIHFTTCQDCYDKAPGELLSLTGGKKEHPCTICGGTPSVAAGESYICVEGPCTMSDLQKLTDAEKDGKCLFCGSDGKYNEDLDGVLCKAHDDEYSFNVRNQYY